MWCQEPAPKDDQKTTVSNLILKVNAIDSVVNFFLVEAETRRRWDIFQAEVTLY